MKNKKKRNGYSAQRRSDRLYAYAMIAPAALLITLFVVIPLGMSVYYSLMDWNFYSTPQYIGLENFRIAVETVVFRQSVLVAIQLVLIIVPLSIMLSFGFALILKPLNSNFTKTVKIMAYLPGLASGIVTGILFAYVFSYHSGIINQFRVRLGLERIAFTMTRFWAMFIIVVPTIWLGFGGGMIMNYAALVNVPEEYYDAAKVDGANAWRQLIHITLPQMKNIFILQLVSGVAGTLQIFELPYIMTGGGPMNSTLTPVMYIYQNYRNPDRAVGFTLAGSLLMMVVIAALNSVVFKIVKSDRMVD